MKRVLLLLLLCTTLATQAQVYNNEWIDYSKTYYKFKIAVNGVYRIPQSLLAANGLSSANADHYQLWRNGQQIPIYTSVQNAPLGAADYIEFWGEMNDGKVDNALYRRPETQLNDRWNLLTDTACYFLTVNPAGGNLRLTTEVNNVAGNTLPAEPYFMHTNGNYYKLRINPGRSELVGTSYTYSSVYDVGEGWTSNEVTTVPLTVNLANLRVYTGAGAPGATLKINAAGNSNTARYVRIKVNGDSIAGPQMNYYDYMKFSKDVPLSLISTGANGGAAAVEMANRSETPGDRMVVASVELTYPRQFHFGSATNFSFALPANAAGNYLHIAGFTYAGVAPVLYDLSNHKRYVGDISTLNIVKFALPPSAIDRQLVLIGMQAANVRTVTALEERHFENYALPAAQGNYLIITNPSLAGPQGGIDPVADYATYRSSPAGGSYNVKVYMIDQLVDQFAFGIRMHPLSIRNFVNWARNNFSQPLTNVLLIGKGVSYNLFRSNINHAEIDKLALVPTFGWPASDNMLTSVGNSSQPLTPIGRISAINRQEIATYLDKVKEYEAQLPFTSPIIDEIDWKKNIIHVTGAGEQTTSNILLTALNGHKAIIEDTMFGGKVYTFSKGTSEAVEHIASSLLTTLFKHGISILTYFGHSSATTLEFNLDNPHAYQNEGRYPVFIVMGCNAGSLYNFSATRLFTKETISENYVLAEKSGSVAFLASTNLGIIHYLDIYNARFYRAMSTTHYGRSLGEIMGETIRQVFALTTENDFYARFQCEQFALHGDPAIRMNSFEKPDYVIEDPLVVTTPSFVSLAESHFKINAAFMNMGRATNRPIVIEVKRTLPNLVTEIIYRDSIPGTRYKDSLTLVVPIQPIRDKGLHKITVTVDADNDVDELYETNNSVTKEVYIFEDELRPIFPYNFSIVNKQDVKMIASTANAFAEMRTYVMEMDTTELFNSPALITRNTNSSGGIVEFTPGITFKDSTVYYWRVSPVAENGDLKWNTHSFVYLEGNNLGFGQAHLYQHFKSEFDHIRLDSTTRTLYFDSTTQSVFIRSGVFPSSFTEAQAYSVTINGNDDIRSPCGISNIIFNVLYPVSLEPWYNAPAGSPGRYGSDAICGEGRTWNFQFNILDPNKRRSIVEFLDLVPDGHYVLVRNCSGVDPNSNTYASDWQNDASFMGAGNTMYDRLKEQGFEKIDSFYRPRAFLFVYRKNTPSFEPRTVMSDGIYDPITLPVDILTPDTLGYIMSPVFGRAKAWHSLKWNGKTIDPQPGDEPSIDIIGVTAAGNESVLMPGITLATPEVDLSSISADQYPSLRLRMKNMDTAHLTPYQLRYWLLTYDPVPEGAIAPNIYFSVKDTVDIGEPANMGIGFKNISNAKFDSLKVKLTVTDKNNVTSIIPVPRQRDIGPSDTIRLNVAVDTRSLSGTNTMFVNFNPDDDQPEQFIFNNFAFHNFYVKPDSLSPLLDVTFDGVHILNRDIVSAQPAILIKLKDEAKWMILDDPNLVEVQVRYPDGTVRDFDHNNSDTLQFIPAGQAPNTDNTASINFKPAFGLDGEYELIVTGRDMSDNAAGAVQYRVLFRVINKPMISNMLNYPNPFTTSTAFVFTLTGSEVPQNLRIQILTVTGKIVREITKDELGPIHIGRNITEFKWDGTDQYGQKLANGVYLYRVVTNLNGKSLDKYKAADDNTDKFFNKGYGKMYLMR